MKAIQHYPSVLKLITSKQASYQDISKPIQTCPNLRKPIQTYLNLSKPIQKYKKLNKPIKNFRNLIDEFTHLVVLYTCFVLA
jgi:hypothetical protein